MATAKSILLALLPLLPTVTASAHLSYAGRNYGTFTGLTLQSNTITGQSVAGAFGWADGTDADFANQHDQIYFKFTLQNTAQITLSVTALDPSNLAVGYSIYRGLGHTSPPDYDYTDVSLAYLATLPGPTKEGAFNALDTWKMGNENGDLSTFTYVGHAADGTSANLGPSEAVQGDGVKDGKVSKSFVLPAGDYTVAIGGADYYKQDDYTVRGITTSISVSPVPEPAGATLLLSGAALLLGMRRKLR